MTAVPSASSQLVLMETLWTSQSTKSKHSLQSFNSACATRGNEKRNDVAEKMQLPLWARSPELAWRSSARSGQPYTAKPMRRLRPFCHMTPAALARFCALVVLVVLAGCASSPEDVRRSAAGKVDFEIERPLAVVFEEISTRARQCIPRDVPDSPPGARIQWIVQTRMNKDQSGGQILFLNRHMGMERHFMVSDFVSLGAARTRITTYYRHSPWERAANNVKGWVTGGSQSCWLKT